MCDKRDESIAKHTAERNAMVLFVPEQHCEIIQVAQAVTIYIHVGILSDGKQILPCTVCLMKVLVSYSFKWNANISICFMWYVQRYIVGSGELPLPRNV